MSRLHSRIISLPSVCTIMQFKQSIATQLSTITGHPETQLIEMIERPKNKDYGQFSIAVYKLMKNGMRKKMIVMHPMEKYFISQPIDHTRMEH